MTDHLLTDGQLDIVDEIVSEINAELCSLDAWERRRFLRALINQLESIYDATDISDE